MERFRGGTPWPPDVEDTSLALFVRRAAKECRPYGCNPESFYFEASEHYEFINERHPLCD